MKRILLLPAFLTLVFLIFSCNNSSEPEVIPYDWPTSTPEKQGLSGEQLKIASAEAESRGAINSMVVIKNDVLVYESYYHGLKKDDIHVIRSCSKSFLSALYGIAIEQGYIKSLSEKLIDYFPEYIEDNSDNRKADITIKHLLTMTSGFGGDQENYNTFFYSGNWIKTICESELEFSPGSSYKYSTGGTHLLAGILTKAVGKPLAEYAQENLFSKIGITLGNWEQDPQGYYFGGNNMFFTTRDMARFGQLYLHDGNLNGEQIVPAGWVLTSTKNLRGKEGGTWGNLAKLGYGYLWWTGMIDDYQVYTALGFGGQYIMNIPDLNMTIAMTSDGYVDWNIADANERSALDIIANYILPAVQ